MRDTAFIRELVDTGFQEELQFQEDVYLCRNDGRVIASRCLEKRKKKDPIFNVFDLFERSDLKKIKDDLGAITIAPFMMLDLGKEVMIINRSIFSRFGIFAVYFPYFKKEECVAIARKIFGSRIELSDELKTVDVENIEITDEHKKFARRLLAIYVNLPLYRLENASNADLIEIMLTLADAYFEFYGCSVALSSVPTREFERANELCMDSYIYFLTFASFIIRNYSVDCDAHLMVSVDKYGPQLELIFDVASQYTNINLVKCTDELRNFDLKARVNRFFYTSAQTKTKFNIKSYPWVVHPDSTDLKKNKRMLKD